MDIIHYSIENGNVHIIFCLSFRVTVIRFYAHEYVEKFEYSDLRNWGGKNTIIIIIIIF